LTHSGHEPFWEKDDQTGIKNTMKADPWRHFKNKRLNVSNEAKDFVSRLLEKKQEKRISGKESLSHRWLKSDLNRASMYEVDKRQIRSYMVRQRWKKVYKGVVFALKIQKAIGGVSGGRSAASGGYDRTDGITSSRIRVYETMKTVHIPIKLTY
jgi:serine/threonine protein kinase